MIFAIVAVTSIVMVSSFGLQIAPVDPIQIPQNLQGTELYVCPMASDTWDIVSAGLRPLARYILFGIFFVIMVLMFTWGWALYQNLLKDKFAADAYKSPWGFTKMAFWAIMIIFIAAMTPNYFKAVTIDGAPGQWVLCENDTPGARAVRASAVH